MILDKKSMTEEDIKLNFITPAINTSGWRNGYNITMENLPTVCDICLVESGPFACYLLNSVEDVYVGIGKIVDYYRFVASVYEFYNCMRTNVSGSTSDYYLFHFGLLFRRKFRQGFSFHC